LFSLFVNIWSDFTSGVVNVDSLVCDLGIVIDGWITVTERVASFCYLAYIATLYSVTEAYTECGC